MREQLQKRLFHYQVSPPMEAWDKINSALDENETYNISDKLMKYQVDPPSSAWDGISAALDENKIPVVPFAKRFSRLIKYGAVAASLIFSIVLINLLFNKKTASEETGSVSETAQINSVPDASNNKKMSSNGVNESIRPETANSVTYLKNEKDMLAVRILPMHAAIVKSNPRINYVVTHNLPIVKSDLLDRYSIFSSETGDAIRVSKKLFDLFLCSEKNEYCKLNIEMVKQQFASPSLLALTDFSGVLDLLQNMNHE